jgi:hypothetical protein
MAIKISGTTVIDNVRSVSNMGGLEGNYSNFHGQRTPITTVLDMSKPMMSVTLSAATTFTTSNIATGKVSLLMLDVTSSGYIPTWPASIQWPGDGTEPDWDATGVTQWLVCFTCWDSNQIRATATGWGTSSGGTSGLVDLGSGTSVYAVSDGLSGSCASYYNLNSAGTYDTTGTNGNPATGTNTSGTWLLSGSASDYELKMDLTNNLGGGGTVSGSATGSWLSCGTNRSWSISDTSNNSGANTRTGTLTIRLASNQTVIDTGTILLSANQDP